METVEKIDEVGQRHGLLMMNVFHAGDGNLHPLMSFDAAEPGALERVEAAGKDLIEVCVAMGGFAVGRARDRLGETRVHALGVQRSGPRRPGPATEAFDPEGCLNPDKILPEGARCFDFGRPPPVGAWV